MSKKDQLPYDYRNQEQKGVVHTPGLKGKTGILKGGFSSQSPSKRKSVGKPPRKMN